MKYRFVTKDQQKDLRAVELKKLEQKHMELSVALEIAEAARNDREILDLKEKIEKIETTLEKLQ